MSDSQFFSASRSNSEAPIPFPEPHPLFDPTNVMQFDPETASFIVHRHFGPAVLASFFRRQSFSFYDLLGMILHHTKKTGTFFHREAMINPNEKLFSPIIPFLLFSFVFASCSSREIKTVEAPKSDAVLAAPRIPVVDPKEKTGIEETDVGSQKPTTARSISESKETRTDAQIRSEIQSLESTPIYFEFDKSDLSPEAQSFLKKLAGWLQNNGTYSVLIEGHCDERGPSGYNIVLGQSRAVAAEKFLTLLGIAAERISTLSYGEERPAAAGKSEEALSSNRRDQFKLKENR